MQADEIQALFDGLEKAFGALPIPSDEDIVYDNTGYHLECNQVRAKFRGRHWKDLNLADLIGEADSLAFFTLEAFRFFLPAFIRASVLDPELADLIPFNILGSFAPQDHSQSWEEGGSSLLEGARAHGIPEWLVMELASHKDSGYVMQEQRRKILNSDQRESVRQFILFLRRHREEDFVSGELDRAIEALKD